ncbi:MAG: dipeptidase [Candidatus Krumholzibacteriia bacterium]
MTRIRIGASSLAVLAVCLAGGSAACTNFVATPGATVDGSVFVTYTCDGEFHPRLEFIPAADHEPGAMQEVRHWNGELRGEIPYPAHTYGVVNLMNDRQVSLAETTTGGRDELINPDGMLHYWQLMRLALQRAGTARECVEVMGRLVGEFGYRSSGESYCIGDPHEAWIMEMVGPGPGGEGAHWVALRVPDGYVSAFANGGRIGTFPEDDPENCLFSPGMKEFAAARGWYDPSSGPFNWREAFHPLTAQQKRYTATRVWSIFRRAAPSQEFSPDYHRGVAGADPYPLWIKPDRKLTTADVFALKRDHYEGTPWDMTEGVDAGPGGYPLRWRPMGFEVDGEQYTWERPISTQQTGFSMVCQSRAWLPDPVGGVTWYGLDDTDFTCYTPLYCSMTDVPPSYATGGLDRFSWDSAWWVFNFVSNFAALRYDEMIVDVRRVQAGIEGRYLDLQPAVEATAASLMKTDPDLAAAYLNDYALTHAEDVVVKWRELGEHLVTRYNDGYVKDESGRPREQGYPEAWLRKVLQQRPEQFRLPQTSESTAEPTDY